MGPVSYIKTLYETMGFGTVWGACLLYWIITEQQKTGESSGEHRNKTIGMAPADQANGPLESSILCSQNPVQQAPSHLELRGIPYIRDRGIVTVPSQFLSQTPELCKHLLRERLKNITANQHRKMQMRSRKENPLKNVTNTRKVNGFIDHELFSKTNMTKILLAFPNCCDVTALLKDFLNNLLSSVFW